jgi:hypothetical protein
VVVVGVVVMEATSHPNRSIIEPLAEYGFAGLPY